MIYLEIDNIISQHTVIKPIKTDPRHRKLLLHCMSSNGVQTKGQPDKRPTDRRPIGQKANGQKANPWNKYEIFTRFYVPFSVIGADYTGPHS